MIKQVGRHAGLPVALKRLLPELARDPEYVDLFHREAAVTRRLHHPACIEVFDTGVAEGTPFIAMEYVDGKNLRQIIAQCRKRAILLPLDFASYVAHVLAQALDHAHAGVDPEGEPLGLVHCDLSPSNVFISKLGEIKLGDFGVALAVGADAPAALGAFGKIHYLAPEQIRGERPTPATDLFALGAMTFELLTNQHAFPGRRKVGGGTRGVVLELLVPAHVGVQDTHREPALVLDRQEREAVNEYLCEYADTGLCNLFGGGVHLYPFHPAARGVALENETA